MFTTLKNGEDAYNKLMKLVDDFGVSFWVYYFSSSWSGTLQGSFNRSEHFLYGLKWFYLDELAKY